MDENYREVIGARIAQKGLTQQELAGKIGILRNNISRIEAGKYDMMIDAVGWLADALGCKVTIE